MSIDDFYLLNMHQFEEDQNRQNPRKEKVYKNLSEQLLTISDYEFRQQFRMSQKIILATTILFNIGRLWGDLWDEDDDEGGDGEGDGEGEADVVVQDNDEASVRIRGQLERDRLKKVTVTAKTLTLSKNFIF